MNSEERKQNIINKKIKRIVSDLSGQDTFHLSREQLVAIIKDEIKRYIDKHDLMDPGKCMRQFDRVNKASKGNLEKEALNKEEKSKDENEDDRELIDPFPEWKEFVRLSRGITEE